MHARTFSRQNPRNRHISNATQAKKNSTSRPEKYMLNQVAMRQLDIQFSAWGGAREGAGRKPRGPRAGVPHHPRERHARAHPVHVTLRARRGLPPFREKALGGALREAVRAANHVSPLRAVFRVVHFSVQVDHVHLVVEAEDAPALARGMQGLAIRLARRINGVLRTRGGVWADRFHSRELRTPRAVRNAIVYVLMNAKKHGMRTDAGVDPFSSAPWFDGFIRGAPRAGPPVRPPGTWLASTGWRRRGLVSRDERPRAPD